MCWWCGTCGLNADERQAVANGQHPSVVNPSTAKLVVSYSREWKTKTLPHPITPTPKPIRNDDTSYASHTSYLRSIPIPNDRSWLTFLA